MRESSMLAAWRRKSGCAQYGQRLLLLSFLILSFSLAPTKPCHAQEGGNAIVLPFSGMLTIEFLSSGGECDGEFGLYSPQLLSICPDYRAYLEFPVHLSQYYEENTELVFYLTPRYPCSGTRLFSSDPSVARITHPDARTWLIGWEDWIDMDYNDLIVEIRLRPGTRPFLDLPYDYAASSFAMECANTQHGGSVQSYFDHMYPTHANSPNATTRPGTVSFSGYDSNQTAPLAPYDMAYDGQDGIDFPMASEMPILAAAPGTVTFAGEAASNCQGAAPAGTTKVVKVQHANGYVTEYWGLSLLAPGLDVGSEVRRDVSQPIGYCGPCEGTAEPCLHFVVRNTSEVAVDPFGWRPLPDAGWYGQTDPWERHNAENGGVDAVSHYLWVHPLTASALLSRSAPTIITSTPPSMVVTIPVGAYDVPMQIRLTEDLLPASIPGRVSIHSFSLFGYPADDPPVAELGDRVEIRGWADPALYFSPALYAWDTRNSTWQAVETTWDPSTGVYLGASPVLGTLVLADLAYRVHLPMVARDHP